MAESKDTKQRRLERAEKFRKALVAHHSRVKPGWQKELATHAGYTEQQISKIVSGARPATVEQMVRIEAALGRPGLIPDDLAAPASARNSATPDRRSDPADRSSDAAVPPDLVEWLHEREGDEADAVRVWELIDILQAQTFPAEPGDPHGAEYYEGMLAFVRRSRASAR